MRTVLRGLAWLGLTLATMALLLVTAHATTFTAQLVNPISGASPQFVRLQLRGCGSNIPSVNGVGVIGADADGYITLWPDDSGSINVNVQDDSTISCAGVTGNAYYHVEVWAGSKTQSTLLRHLLSQNDYHITGSTFDLNNPGTPLTAAPLDVNVVNATDLKGKKMVGTLGDGQGWCLDIASGNMVPCTTTAGSGTFTAAHDLSGSSTNQTVVGIQGTAVDAPVGTGNVILSKRSVVNKTSNYSVQSGDSGKFFTNKSATGEVDFTLPSCSTAGFQITALVDAAQTVKLIASGGAKIRYGSTLSTANGNIVSSSIPTTGDLVNLQCIGSSSGDGVAEWVVDSLVGVWIIN